MSQIFYLSARFSRRAGFVYGLFIFTVTVGCSDRSGSDVKVETPVMMRPSDTSEPVVGDWTATEDGVLSIRLCSPRQVFAANEPFNVVGEIRNDSERPVGVLRDVLSHHTLSIVGPQGKLRYTGDVASVIFGGSSFVELMPGESIERQVALSEYDFAGMDAGSYSISSTYRTTSATYTTEAKKRAVKDFWIGEVSSQPIQLRKTSSLMEGSAHVSGWRTSTDGTFRIQIEASKPSFDTAEAISLLIHIRNVSERQVDVLLTDDYDQYYGARSDGVNVAGPQGRLRYRGASPARKFVRFEAGMVSEAKLELTEADFAGINEPGSYTMNYTYAPEVAVGSEAREHGFDRLWTGSLTSQSIVIQRNKLNGNAE